MKRLPPSALLLILLLVLLPAWVGTAQAARHALVIGNNAYPEDGQFGPFKFDYPHADAKGISGLISRRAFGFETPLLLLDADKPAMDRGLERFLERLSKGDTVLFYFSGHGVQVGGYNYLLPVGNNFRRGTTQIKYQAVNANEWVESIQARIGVNGTQIAILDACRNDMGKGSEGAGLTEMGPGGALIAYAASPGKRALARGKNSRSLYTGHLLEVWKQAPRLPVEQIFKKTRVQVAAATRKAQIPWTGGNLLGDFCLDAPCLGFHSPRDDGGSGFEPVITLITVPEMVALKGGCFKMGSPLKEKERSTDERQHRVCVEDFNIGKYEVTFDEYDDFAEATGRKKPDDQGWGRGRRPVINVSWHDATAYAEWLSQQTGRPYRLPTEAEWEYAARAGTTTPFWSGECIHTDQANYDGNYPYSGCGSKNGVNRKKPLPVEALAANPWGLKHVAGNVWEWTCSEYAREYSGQEQRCEARGSGPQRVLRGGSWGANEGSLRSAQRGGFEPVSRSYLVGFRLAGG